MSNHPTGSVQAICSSATGLATMVLAFVGFVGYTGKSSDKQNWAPHDLLYLIPSGIAFVLLVSVAFAATRCDVDNEKALTSARWILCFGTLFAVLSVFIFFAVDVSTGIAANK